MYENFIGPFPHYRSDKPHDTRLGRRGQWANTSRFFLDLHIFPKPVFVEPDRIRIPGDEFVDSHAVNHWFAWNSLLLAIDKDRHELRLALAPRTPFGTG
jgi:hypothetical protein